MGWRIIRYIQHLFNWKHRKGHGIHSPYLYEFINGVVFNGDGVKVPVPLLNIHKELLKEESLIPAPQLEIQMGAGSRTGSRKPRSVRSFVRSSSVNRAQGALLYRIVRWLHPVMILEFGTGLGVSTLYLAWETREGSYMEKDSFQVHTIEGDPARADFSQKLFQRIGLNGIKVHCGDVNRLVEELSTNLSGYQLAFVDANHRYEPTVRYLERLIHTAGEEAVIVMDDIYWSKGMFRAWKEVISWPGVRVSIDLFHMGILLLRKDLQKTHLKIKF